jgi:hypothetical protein
MAYNMSLTRLFKRIGFCIINYMFEKSGMRVVQPMFLSALTKMSTAAVMTLAGFQTWW